MIIQNDHLLLICILSIIILIFCETCYQLFAINFSCEKEDNCDAISPELNRSKNDGVVVEVDVYFPPVHRGSVRQDCCVEDFLRVSRFVPHHSRIPRRLYSIVDGSNLKEKKINTLSVRGIDAEKNGNEIFLLPESDASFKMMQLFPNEKHSDIVRFLTARKGNVEEAADMMRSALEWRSQYFPSKKLEIIPALSSGAFFAHGKALDGSPVLYFRGAYYNGDIGTPLQYILAATYVIDTVLGDEHTNFTILVHSCRQEGAPNQSADTDFIKQFVKLISDIYPERLNLLVIYPIPFVGRMLWSIIKIFVDKTTQSKIILLSGERIGYPPDLAKYVDPQEIPLCCGGFNSLPIFDFAESIADEKETSPSAPVTLIWST